MSNVSFSEVRKFSLGAVALIVLAWPSVEFMRPTLKAQTDIVTILPVGDSITVGTGAPAGEGYRSTLWRQLELDGVFFNAVGTLQDPNTYRDPDHSGHAGWMIADLNLFLPDTLPPILPFQPDYILLMIGTNDVFHNRDLQNAGTRLTALLDRMFSFVPDAMILVASIPPSTDAAFNTRAIAYNQRVATAVADQIARGRRAQFVDVHSSVTASDLSADGLHPNAQGYVKIANAWHQALRAHLGEVTPTNQPPTVSLMAPGSGTVWTSGTPIGLAATAADSDGTVTKVEFFAGATKLGEDGTAPYELTWSGAGVGPHSLTARAIDNGGVGTTSGAVTVTVNGTGAASYAAVLNGAAYMVGPVRTGLNITGVITVEAWIKTTATTQQGIVERFNSYGVGSINGGYALRLQGGKLKFFTCKNGAEETGTVVGATPVTLGVWHHVAGVYDGSRVQVYLDGVLDGSAPATAGPGTGVAETKIGTRGDSVGIARFVGQIDEARITAGVAYTGPFVPAPRLGAVTGTRGLWTFDAQNGVDTSGAGHHLVALSAVTFTNDVPSGGGGTPSNQVPTTSLTAPAAGSLWQAGANIGLSATASDADGTVTKVEFFTGATKLGEDTTAPYELTWTGAAAGNHSLTARATDNVGTAASSSPVNITVNPTPTNQPPTVSLTAPGSGTVWTSGTPIGLAATAADSDGTVMKVEFFAGATKLGEDGTAPYELTWSGAGVGPHSLTARAIDNGGVGTTSGAVTVTVNGTGAASYAAVLNGAAYMVGPVRTGLNITGVITVEAWIKTTATTQQGIVERFNSYGVGSINGGYALRLQGGKLKFFTCKNGAEETGTVVGATPVTLGVWHHVAGVYDGSRVQVYLDGVLDGSAPATAGPGTGVAETKIGTRGDSVGIARFVGQIDEARITAGVAYTGPFVPAPRLGAVTGTRGLWTFDAQNGVDTSGAGHHLVALSAVTFTNDVPSGGGGTPSNQVPTTSLTAPAAGSLWQAGANIGLSATASDADGTVTKVEFFTGATKLGEDTTAPYELTWTGAAAGNHSLTARAFDNLGATTSSNPITISINAPPSVVLTVPSGGELVEPVNLTLAATASDSDGNVTTVEFFSGATKLGEDTTSPYGLTWNDIGAGSHSLTARAIDNRGAATSSPPTLVTVHATTVLTEGLWSQPVTWPLAGAHLSLLPNGKVLVFDFPGQVPRIWDPSSGTFSAVPNSTTQVFGSGHTFLPDGRLLVAGGHLQIRVGPNHTNVFDFRSNAWFLSSPMNAGRWYPTTTTLPSGDVLVVGGAVDGASINSLPQVRTSSGTYRNLNAAVLSIPASTSIYPWMFVAPDGRVFNAGPDQATRYLNTSGSGFWTPGPSSNFGDRAFGSAVMYEPGKVLLVGGGSIPTSTAEVLDLTQPTPVWHYAGSMAVARRDHHAVALPDGTVLVVGGTSAPDGDSASAVLGAERWEPSTDNWTMMASISVPRVANSSAILLPDARILTAGSASSTAQIFSPPYLFRGPRPTITSAPSTITFGESFLIETPAAASIAQVTWLRLPSESHSFDQNQRFNRLAFQQQSGRVQATAPTSSAEAPPGHYMLFVVNDNGVPSVARIVSLVLAPTTPFKLMPLGDSLTYGIGMPEHAGYRLDLLDKLATAGVSVDFVGSVVSGPSTMSDRDHEGHFGWDILEISAMVDSWLATQTPQVILLLLGTNDILEGATSATAAARLNSLIGQIYARLPQVSLVVSTLPPLGSSTANQQVIAYNSLIPGIAADHAAQGRHIAYVDIANVMSVSDLVDGIHPGANGYSKMATAWFEKLMQVLQTATF